MLNDTVKVEWQVAVNRSLKLRNELYPILKQDLMGQTLFSIYYKYILSIRHWFHYMLFQ